MNWNNIVGHEAVIERIRMMLRAARVPHALLFCGPEGVGKRLVAERLAAALLCQEAADDQACGHCLSCRQLADGQHPDFVRILPDGASIKIEQIRQLQHEVSMVPYYGGYRVCLLEACDLMTEQAANSLLKILEEPPGQIVFILLSARRNMLLPTILSRCLTLDFVAPSWPAAAAYLAANGVAPLLAETAARLASGRIGAALALAAPEGLAVRDRAFQLLRDVHDRPSALLWEVAAACDKQDRRSMRALLQQLTQVLRDLLVLAAGAAPELIFNRDLLPALGAEVVQWPVKTILAAVPLVREAEQSLTFNANIRLTMEALCIKLLELTKGGDVFADSRRSAL